MSTRNGSLLPEFFIAPIRGVSVRSRWLSLFTALPFMPLNPSTIEAIRLLMQRAGLNESDLREQFVLGSGAGGQKINKTSSAVRLTHLPSGLMIKVQASRSREDNRWLARRALAEKILEELQGIRSARQQEREKIRRQKRRRSRRQRNRMLDDKAKHAEKKAARRWTVD